ncbi:MAG: hypothetical protein K2X66_18870 [Cyanobacteria bacterium]|nr:hypothetical protein [Cyanobacteriota bacterium]
MSVALSPHAFISFAGQRPEKKSVKNGESLQPTPIPSEPFGLRDEMEVLNPRFSRPSFSIAALQFRGNPSNNSPHLRLILNAPGFKANEIWAKAMWTSVQSAVSRLNTPETAPDFNTILEEFSQAYVAQTGKGVLRPEHRPRVISFVSGPHASPDNILRRKAYEEKTKQKAMAGVQVTSLDQIQRLNLPFSAVPPQLYVNYEVQDGIKLTGSLFWRDSNGNESVGWEYVDGKTTQQGKKRAQAYFEQALALKGKITPETLPKAIETIAAVHWWMVQSIPFTGGIAGISDMVTKTLFETLGIETSPWKQGIAPDMEVFVHSLADYQKKYASFFNQPLLPKNIS